jgi:LysR family transcriptional regulator, glycine cleavage system transcriptional activator
MNDDGLPPLKALRAFEAAARCGSFVAAAEDLHVTHWAIGKQVRLLEDWLGTALFERRGRGVALTGEGAELLADVSETFARLAGTARRLRKPDPAQRVSGIVRASVLPSFALRWLFPRLATFLERYPSIDLRISTTSRKLRYIGAAFDIGIRSSPELSAGLRSETLMADVRRPACSPGILRSRPLKAVEDLSRHTLLHALTTRSAWSDWLSTIGMGAVTPIRHIEFEHAYLQIEAAVHGLGVALAPLPLIEADLVAGRLVCPIDSPGWHAGTYELIVSKDREHTVAVAAFRDWIITAARNDTPSAPAPD